MKVCFRCLKEKALDSYYKHPQMKDGHLNKCIDCCKVEANERLETKMKDPQFAIKEKARHLEKPKTDIK